MLRLTEVVEHLYCEASAQRDHRWTFAAIFFQQGLLLLWITPRSMSFRRQWNTQKIFPKSQGLAACYTCARMASRFWHSSQTEVDCIQFLLIVTWLSWSTIQCIWLHVFLPWIPSSLPCRSDCQDCSMRKFPSVLLLLSVFCCVSEVTYIIRVYGGHVYWLLPYGMSKLSQAHVETSLQAALARVFKTVWRRLHRCKPRNTLIPEAHRIVNVSGCKVRDYPQYTA